MQREVWKAWKLHKKDVWEWMAWKSVRGNNVINNDKNYKAVQEPTNVDFIISLVTAVWNSCCLTFTGAAICRLLY